MSADDPKLETALCSIQPLRDLAKNWDVDIASCLQDFLQEIASVVKHEQSAPITETTKFTQAALLLHNSSNVYSRKVEYLYTLVFNALDNLNLQNQKNHKQASSRRVDAEIEEFERFDEHLDFLLLDDVIPIDESKIDLPPSVRHSVDTTVLLPSTTRLSLGISATVDRSAICVAQNTVVSALNNGCGILQQTEGNSDGMFYMRGTNDSQNPQSRLSSFGEVVSIMSDQIVFQGVENSGDGDFHTHNDDDDDSKSNPTLEVSNPIPPCQQSMKQHSAWNLLDPHDTGQTKARPLRIGITYILPEGIIEPPSQSVTGARSKKRAIKQNQKEVALEKKQPICMAIATFKATMANQESRRQQGHLTNDQSILERSGLIERHVVPLQGLAFGGEFAYIAQAATKRKAAERREKRKLLRKRPEAIAPQEADHLMGYDDNDQDFGGIDDDSYYVDDGDNGGLALFDAAFAAREDATNPASFEELCRAHIQAFAKGAEKYCAETNLTQRVGNWQKRLSPILEEEASRPEFNIHAYADHIIDSIQTASARNGNIERNSKNREMHFASLTQNKERYEVCRLFLASLSLLNSGNIIFHADGGGVMRPETLKMELLNSTVDRPMKSFLAPFPMEEQRVLHQHKYL